MHICRVGWGRRAFQRLPLSPSVFPLYFLLCHPLPCQAVRNSHLSLESAVHSEGLSPHHQSLCLVSAAQLTQLFSVCTVWSASPLPTSPQRFISELFPEHFTSGNVCAKMLLWMGIFFVSYAASVISKKEHRALETRRYYTGNCCNSSLCLWPKAMMAPLACRPPWFSGCWVIFCDYSSFAHFS